LVDGHGERGFVELFDTSASEPRNDVRTALDDLETSKRVVEKR
jgi:hypothetical protein